MMEWVRRLVYWVVLGGVLVGGVVVRVYKINSPIADWHSWRQADTAAVTRNFLKRGVDLLHPRFDDLSSVASGRENPQGWRFVEFPIYNLAAVGVYRVLPGVSIEVAGRLVSIVSSLVAALMMASLVGRYRGRGWGMVAAGVYLFLPFNIFYSRAVLPEPLAVGLALCGYVTFLEWWERGRRWGYWGSGMLWAAAILVKPTVGFLGLPILYLVWQRYRFGAMRRFNLWGWAMMVVWPFLAWRGWMSQFPEGIPASRWLLNGDGIRLRPAWWRWLFGERLGRLMLGGWGLTPVVSGLLVKVKDEEKHLWGVVVGAVLYLVVFATGNVRHDYYQIVVVPAVALLLTWGIWWWWEGKAGGKWRGRLLMGVCLVLGWGMGWYQVREYYRVNRSEIVEAGERVDKLVPEEARVIAPYNGDTAFLYQTNRQGWPVVTASIEEMKTEGASYYVSVDFSRETNEVMSRYQVVEKTDKYVIVRLDSN